ncbi:hypothetical protein BH24ACI3_BH24ACI3_05090 [soil metagenome]
MKENKAYRSEAAAAIHETASGRFEAAVIDKQTMRDFDATCLAPMHEFPAGPFKALREREQTSVCKDRNSNTAP